MKVLLVFISLFSGVLLHAQHSIDALLKAYNEDGIPYISVTEARMFQLHNKAIILDAREREEFEVSAIPSAKYIGYKGFSPEEIAQTFLDKDKLIIVYCSVGIRSFTIAKKLKELGSEFFLLKKKGITDPLLAITFPYLAIENFIFFFLFRNEKSYAPAHGGQIIFRKKMT